MSRYPWLIILIVMGTILSAALAATALNQRSTAAPQLVAPVHPAEGFARAAAGRALTFPADYGAHPDYQTEWWYYTGNLFTDDGRHFGYQLTFFRRALLPQDQRQQRSSAWATDQVYMAHFALTDSGNRRFSAAERFSRGAADLAGAQAAPYRVWLEDWSVEETAPGMRRLRAANGTLALDLALTDSKGPVLQGDAGYSVKGPEPGNASYYYSLTRLASVGTVQLGNDRFDVSGLSWMDHEWSTSALGPNQVGWDWFALQLDDGAELMVFQLRRNDGSIDTFSSGTYIAPNGTTRRLQHQDFTIVPTATWRSPRSGALYPSRWTVKVASEGLSLTIEPHLADQELNVSFTYWEGAVRVTGEHNGRVVRGNGYVELTGCAASMQGQF